MDGYREVEETNVAVSGEPGDACGEQESWKERLSELQGYNKEDTRNMDETGCFMNALPDWALE